MRFVIKPKLKIKKDTITISHGMRFPLSKTYPQFLIMLLIVFLLLIPSQSSSGGKFIIIGLLLFIIIVGLTSNTGIRINLKKEKIFEYYGCLGFRFGASKEFKKYSCLVLKTTEKKKQALNMYMEVSTSDFMRISKSTEIFFMNSSHRRKVLCGSFDTFHEAKEFAEEISRKLNYPIEKFAPKINTRRR